MPPALAVGTYVDTITVTAPGAASGSPATIYDTLRITAAVVPVALAVSPAYRNVVVTQGTSAPSDNATVTLTGTNAASTAWSASKKKSWTTLTTSSGTGSGTVAWSRNVTGLSAGTYVDTITVTAPGAASGSPATIYDTLQVTAAVVPVALAVSPAYRNVVVTQGASAPSDNATVTLTGTNAASTAWSASKKKSWTTLTTSSGTGSGTVAWSRNATGLAVGTYVDTITVTAPGAASGSPAMIYDTLQVTAAAVPIVLAVSPGSRNVAVTQGSSAPSDNASVTLSGTGAASTAWSANKKQSWTTLTTSSGTGSGTVAWSRNASGLAVGTYVDTITVTAPGAASGSPATIYDTLRITAAVVPVALSASPGSRNVTVTQGTSAPSDNATVTLTGTNAASTAWSASKKKSWTTLTTSSGTGSGMVAWSRNASGLAVGIYVDTITVTDPGAASGSPATIYDTLQVTTAAVPLALAVSPASRNVAVTQGTGAPSDNATVTLSGTGAASTAWSASKKKSWTTLTTSSGTGSGMVAWSRNASGLAVGTYVDTITVTAPGAASGSPARIYDTLRITAAVVPVALSVSPAYRNVVVTQGTSAPSDNATVTLTGTNAASTAWSASRKKSWTTLTNSSATGSGTVTWSRNVTNLAAGIYVDTITVTAAGAASGSPGTIYDTIRITAAPIKLHPGNQKNRVFAVGRSSSVVDPTTDSAVVEMDAGADPSDTWTASTSSSRLQIVSTAGPLGSALVWQQAAITLPVGLYIDTSLRAAAARCQHHRDVRRYARNRVGFAAGSDDRGGGTLPCQPAHRRSAHRARYAG